MKTCSGFRLRAPSMTGSRHHALRNAKSRAHRLSASVKTSSVHTPQLSVWKTSDILKDIGVWTEATEICESVMLFDRIGEGRFGAVFRGIDALTGEKVAVKQIQTRGNGIPGSKVAPFKVALEADIHKAVSDCPSVTTLKSHLRLSDKDCLVTELCEGGNLAAYSGRRGALTERQVAAIAKEAAHMLRTCHQRDILHGDIKAANFVIRSEKDASKLTNAPTRLRAGWLKAVDFGHSMRMGKLPFGVFARHRVPFREGKVFASGGDADELAARGFCRALWIGLRHVGPRHDAL